MYYKDLYLGPFCFYSKSLIYPLYIAYAERDLFADDSEICLFNTIILSTTERMTWYKQIINFNLRAFKWKGLIWYHWPLVLNQSFFVKTKHSLRGVASIANVVQIVKQSVMSRIFVLYHGMYKVEWLLWELYFFCNILIPLIFSKRI